MSLSEQEIRDQLFRGTTQAQLAKKLKVSRAYVNDLYHGRRRISDKLLKRLGYERVIIKTESFRKVTP